MPSDDPNPPLVSSQEHWEESNAVVAQRPRTGSIPPTLKISIEPLRGYQYADQETGLFHLPPPVDGDASSPESSALDPIQIEKLPGHQNNPALVTNEYARPTLSRHSWQVSNSQRTPADARDNDPRVPQRRSWEPTSMLNIAPVQRRLSHHRGGISLDFSASELARRNELIDYRRALDIISDAGSSPRAPSFPPSIPGRATPHSDEETSDSKLAPKPIPSRYSASRVESASRNALQLADKSPTDTQTPEESHTQSNTLDIKGKEAADLASELHDVCG